jgi:hypothetical protein
VLWETATGDLPELQPIILRMLSGVEWIILAIVTTCLVDEHRLSMVAVAPQTART